MPSDSIWLISNTSAWYLCLQYQAHFEGIGSENELCHVFLGKLKGKVHPNQNEIERIRFIAANDLDDELNERPEEFTPWFLKEWKTLRESHSSELANYLM